jgi:hypothetical protein
MAGGKRRARSDKPYVLTTKDAWALLAAATDYMHEPDRRIDGRDRADILAEAGLAKGLSDLSWTISAIHSSVMGFHKGNYKDMQYLLETPDFREIVQNLAKGTEFEMAADRLFQPLRYITEVADKVGERTIDWEASSKVLLRAKKERFPEDLTMVEKLAVGRSPEAKRGK